MATVVDQKIVQMKFDNKEFDDGVRDTMTLLEKFKLALGFNGATKGLEEIDKAAQKVDLSGLSESANAVSSRFDAMQVVAITALANITNSAVNAGKQIVSSLTIDQVTSGFDKYEQKIQSVQTIMNATGKSIDEVAAELDKLIWFTDETSYSFTDMVNNVGKFTSNQIELETAVRAMMGIADAAGLAGASVTDASHAMDGFSKAIAVGYMNRQNWQWIQTAHMDTAEFKKQLMEAAYQAGTLNKVGEDLYETIGKKTTVSVADFESAMSEGWLTTEAMLRTLDQFGGYAEQVYKLYDAGMATSDAIEALSGSLSDVGEAGFKASQEAKTFTDAINAVKDAVSSGWMQTFEYIFGNKDEAVSLWTDFTNELWEIFASGGERRNEVLSEWVEWGGRDQLLDALYEAYENVKAIVSAIQGAFSEMFPPYTVETLKNLTLGFANLVKQLTPSQEALYTIYVVVKAILTPFRLLFTVIKNIANILGLLAIAVFKLGDAFLAMWAKGNPIAQLFQNIFGEERYAKLAESFSKILERIGNFFTPIVDAVKQLVKGETELTPLATFMQKVLDILNKVGNVLLDLVVDGVEKLANFDFTPIVNFFKSIGDFFKSGFDKGGDLLSTMVKNFQALTSNLQGEKPANLIEGVANAIANLKNQFVEFLNSLGKTEAAQIAGEWIGRLTDFLKALGESLMGIIERLTPARILLYAFGISMVSLIYSVSGAVSSLSGVFESFSGVMDALASRIGGKSSPIEEISKAIMMLVASVLILTMIDPEKLEAASWSLVKIAGSLAGVFVVVSAIGMLAQKIPGIDFEKFNDSVRKLSVSIVILAGAMALVSASLFLLDKSDMDSIPAKLLIIVGVMAALSLVVLALTRMPKFENDAIAMIASIASIAIGINLIVGAINKMQIGDWKTMAINLAGVTIILIALKAVLANSYGVNFSSAMGLLVTILSLTALARALQSLAKFDTNILVEGLINFIPVFAALSSLCVALGILGNSLSKITSSILKIGIAVLALSGVIKLISGMEWAEIGKGLVVISAILAFFKIFQLLTSQVLVLDGSGLKDTFVGLGLSLLAISAAIAILGTMKLEVVIQGTLVVGALITLLSLVVLASKHAEKVSGTIISLTAAVIALSAAVALLSLLEPEEAIVAVGSVTALLIALGATLKLIGSGKFSLTGMLNLVEIVLLLLGMAYGLTQLSKMGLVNAIPNLTALSASMVVLAVCLQILAKTTKIAKESNITWDQIGVLILIIGGLGVIAIAMAKLADMVGISNTTTLVNGLAGMTGIILALSVCLKAFQYLEKTSKMEPKQLATIITSLGMLGIVGGLLVIGIEKFIPKDIDPLSMATKIISMAGAITALSACMMILDKLWKIPIMKPAELAKVGVSMFALGAIGSAIVGALSLIKVDDPVGLLTSVASMSAALLALSGVLAILSVVAKTIKSTDWASLGVIGLALVAVATIGGLLIAALNKIEVKDPNGLVTTVLSLSAAMMALSVVVAVMGNVAKLVQGVNMASMAQLLGIIALTMLVAGVIAYAASYVPLETIQNGGKVLLAIGEAIGNFVGGIIGGVVGGTISGVVDSVAVALAGFVETAAPFIDLITSGDGDKLLAGLGSLTGLLLGLTADSIISGILKLVGGDTSLKKFGEQLAFFGDDFVDFAETLDSADVDIDKLTKLIDAASKMTEFAAGIPPQDTDTLRSWVLGDTSLASFGEGLASFANGIADMTEKALGFDISDETIAAYKKLTAFASEIPAQTGTLKSWLVGDTSLATFGKNLSSFSDSIAKFNEKALSFEISQETVDSYSRLAKFAAEIPAQPSWFTKWFGDGDTSISKFGAELYQFGIKIANYYKQVEDIDDPELLVACIKPLEEIIALGSLDNLSKFNLNIFTGLKTALVEMSSYPIDQLPDFRSLGFNTIQNFAEGLQDTTLLSTIKTTFNNLLASIAKIFTDNKTVNKIWGMDLVQNIISGINEKSGDALTAIENLCSAMVVTAEANLGIASPSTVFKSIGNFITEGLVSGINGGAKKATEAIAVISNAIIGSVKSIFEIHSPSVVMEEMGHFVVQGLAEGITGDMSAVEAAKQMASNISAAFKEGLDALSLDISTLDLEQQLWEALYGEDPRVTEEEINAKKMETLEKKMTAQAEKVAYAEAQYKAVVQAVGEETEEAQTAYNSYLQEMITLTGLAKEILGDQTVETVDQRQAVSDYIDYMNQYKEPLLAMGFTMEEIEKAARDASGYLAGADPYANVKMVDELVNEYLQAVTVELDTTVAEAIESAVQREVAEAVATGSAAGLSEGLEDLGAVATPYSYNVGDEFSSYLDDLMSSVTGEDGEGLLSKLFNPEDFAGSLASMFDINLDWFNENASGFLNSIGEFGRNALNKFLSAWGIGDDGSSEEFEAAGEYAMEGLMNGIQNGETQVNGALGLAASRGLNTVRSTWSINSPSEEFKDIGMYAMEGLMIGFEEGTDPFLTALDNICVLVAMRIEAGMREAGDNAGTTLATTLVDYKESIYDAAYTLGEQLCQGMIKGINDNAAAVAAAAQGLAMGATQHIGKMLLIRSPSKVTEELGMYFDLGFANGITNYAGYAEKASEDVATDTVSSLNDAISEAAAMAENVLDGEPVIRPVLDLDSLKKDMSQISGMFSTQQAIGIQTEIAKNQTSGKIQNGVDSATDEGTNFTFVQNNYSPKALTRAEIYRQTNNQFSAFKERVSLAK